MTELWVREQLAELLTSPAPQPPDYRGLLEQGRRQRRRRRRRTAAGVLAVALIAAAVPVAVLRSGSHPAPSTLVAGGSPSPSAGVPDGRSAPYWFEQDTSTFYKRSGKGALSTSISVNDLWLGHNRPTVLSSGNGPTYPRPTAEPAFGKAGYPYGSAHSWDAQWTTATTTLSVRSYLKPLATPFPSEPAVFGDEDLFSAGATALLYPGPATFRRAVITFMKRLPEVSTSGGKDDAGRAATVLTFDEGPTGATSTAFVDLSSATLLETAEQLHPGGTASHVVSTTNPRMQDIWRDTGPVTTAPAGATTPAQQEAAQKAHPQGLTVAHKQGAAGQACTPGVPVDINKVRDRLASMCLDTTVPRFGARRNDDSAAVDGASFYLSDGPLPKPVKQSGGGFTQGSNGASLTLQILPGLKSFILSGGSHDLTPRNGKVGTTTYVGKTTVLGVSADEISEDGQIGILANIDGMSLECYADAGGAAPVTYGQLVAVINHLRWDRLGR